MGHHPNFPDYGDHLMETELKQKAEALALEMATKATTLEKLNGLMRTLMKSALEHFRRC